MSVDWAEVYRSTYQDLVRFLYRKVWDADRAQDLAQESFVRALDHAPDNPRAWLFTVASNLARDEARTGIRRRQHLTLLRDDADVAPSRPPEPDRQVEDAERRDAVRRALECLTDRDREALLLWDAGLDYEEIARQTGIAVGSVGTTLARARRRLVEAHAALEGSHVARG
ncbi:MAG TPA: sigma-70 family RNA polymerase sigma factor [Longimicrobiales bacterium]|nr:sigma-70 family RNA polymerase sigma factor [Longimicrobiales bacterium]